jgi:predicted molibdopterin-dependent oxidoreductase YjgC
LENTKSCSVYEAIKMLDKGAFMFASRVKPFHKTTKGCKKCKVSRNGNYCHECGAKVSDDLKLETEYKVVSEYRFKKDNNIVHMETKDQYSFYSNRKECDMTLNEFMKLTSFSWIWP